MKIILCSESPRRKSILKNHNINFISIPAKINEINIGSLNKILFINTIKKLLTVIKRNKKTNTIYISFDTIVYCKKKILGKQNNVQELTKTLTLLSKKYHKVITKCFLYKPINNLSILQKFQNIKTYFYFLIYNKFKKDNYYFLIKDLLHSGIFIDKSYISKVKFKILTKEQILNYVKNEKNIYDAAGGYKIQENGIKLIKSIKGDFYNIIGLPKKFITTIKNYI